jgi:BirA family biotin operon repressor/biotin-[acetyl-CoA-carboxylase] ligase
MRILRKHFSTIPSTNTWAKQNVADLAPDALTLVTADEQTAGRGRSSRQWISPSFQNIYASYCFFLDFPRSDIGTLALVMGLSAVNALAQWGFTARLKWPNDIFLKGKKLGGILIETVQWENKLCVIAGIGLNINMPQDLLQAINRPTTSLLVENGAEHSVISILDILTKCFHKDLRKFIDEGFIPFYLSYKNTLYPAVGECIRFHQQERLWEGVLEGVGIDGSIILNVDGMKHVFHSGELEV